MQLLQHFECDVHLPAAAVHHDQIRKSCETAILLRQVFFFHLLHLTHAMRKSSRQHLIHGGIVIRSRHRPQLELPVITPLWLAFLIHDHGADRLKAARIRDIVRLHAV